MAGATKTAKAKKAAKAAKAVKGAKAAKGPAARKAAAKPQARKLALGKVARVILYASDFERTVAFYTKTLGLPLNYKEDGWASLGTEGTEVNIHAGHEGHVCVGDTHLAFRVDDLDGAYAALKERGVAVSDIFSPCAGKRCASFKDPDGNCLGIEGE